MKEKFKKKHIVVDVCIQRIGILVYKIVMILCFRFDFIRMYCVLYWISLHTNTHKLFQLNSSTTPHFADYWSMYVDKNSLWKLVETITLFEYTQEIENKNAKIEFTKLQFRYCKLVRIQYVRKHIH